MAEDIRYRGRIYTEREFAEIRDLIAQNLGLSRWSLSKELCRKWNWVQANGALKDMLCRSLLVVLDREGAITLPPRKQPPTFHLRKRRPPPALLLDTSPVAGKLSDVRPVTLTMVRRTPLELVYKSLIHEHHYLGYTTPVGEHLEYIAFSHDRPIACLGFSSAPRHIGVRDRYLGWTKEERIANLHKIAVNTRFLILPWVAPCRTWPRIFWGRVPGGCPVTGSASITIRLYGSKPSSTPRGDLQGPATGQPTGTTWGLRPAGERTTIRTSRTGA
jgi:hypothetical protein